jgi:MoaA/NifB/PqqE/SkfB family radical SAM enzyme
MEDLLGIKDPPFLRNVGLLVTFHCQASCAHCILRAGPDRHEEVSMENARNWIRQIAEYRDNYVYILSLTGGEPFHNLNLLREIMEYAADLKLYISVITNGFWATSQEKAKQILQSLPKICFMSVSTDLYHQVYIPFENVKNAIRATKELGIPHYISIITDNKKSREYQQLNAEILQLTEPENLRVGITFPVGRASELKSELKYKLAITPPKEVCGAASSPCIFPDGRVYGCIGPLIDLHDDHPLYLGNLNENSVAEVFDKAETNVLLHALRLWGPKKLVSILREAGLGQYLPPKYVSGSVCNACYDLMSRSVLRDWLGRLEQDPEFRRKVAYGRLFHLNEPGMLELSGY